MIKFSIKIDDDIHSLNKEDGIALDKVGDLLKNLFNAIDNGSGHKITLGDVRGNCYALDFYTKDNDLYQNFITVHKNIAQLDVDALTYEQKKYAVTLKTILGGRYFLTAYDEMVNKSPQLMKLEKSKLPVSTTRPTLYMVYCQN